MFITSGRLIPLFLSLRAMKKQFYEKALPSQGVYCVTGIKDGKAVNRFTESLTQLFIIIDELVVQGNNTFVALHTFKGHSRRSEDSLFARSFFIDLDVGDGPKKYGSKYEALEALGTFVEFAELVPPIVVDSGTGVHAYWLFDRDIPSLEWRAYADKFKSYCSEHMKIDPTVTADRSRIMRCPDTLNYKTDPPSLSKFLTDDFVQHDFDLFKQFLGEVNLGVASVLKAAKKGLDEDTRSLLKTDNIETIFSIIANKSLTGSGCNQIKIGIEQASTLSEPLWHSGLSIVRQCSDWEEAIHLFSEDYPKYNRELTIRKANETIDKPHSCEVFESRNPEGCADCPHRGKITNPLVFGRQLKESDTEEEPVRFDENTQDILALTRLPAELRPYQRGINGGIYFAPQEAEPILLWAHDVYPIKRMFGNSEGEYMLMRHVLPHDPPREFLMPVQASYSQEEFKKIFTKYGVFFKQNAVQHMMNYVISWATYMLNQKPAEQTRRQMGWTEDNKGFVVGNVEYRQDGTEGKTAASSLIHSIAKLLGKQGEYSKWRAAADKLDIVGLEMAAFGLLCGFGSPLMRYTSVNGVTVCYLGESGNGKSGALYAGLSLFGEPKGLGLSGNKKTSATENALVQYMLGLKNIMMGLDEASNRKPEELSDLIYKVTEGKGKLRLQHSVDAVREIEFMTSLITFMATNQSVTDKLLGIKNNPDGELARLIELPFNKPQPFIRNPELAPEIFEGMRINYGHAGPMYIKELYRLGDVAIQEIILKWTKRFVSDFGSKTEYRFYSALMSVAFAGGEIAINAGIIKLNLDRIYEVVLAAMMEVRDGPHRLNVVDYESILGEFQNSIQGSTLIMNENKVVEEPRFGLLARIELDTCLYYVSAEALRDHLRKIQVGQKGFFKYMREKKLLVFEGKTRLSNGWQGRSRLSAISVLGFRESILPELFKKDGNQPTDGRTSLDIPV